tara:strand:+ start:599 stop:1327 length:729 start_codon:yes stop_codon:yes gene_type:complete
MTRDFLLVIPARYESSRFPGKPLAQIKGMSMIYRVWEKCISAVPRENVFIATDDSRIELHCKENDMNFVMTSENCLTGTDRVAEVAKKIPADFYINVQGDEPLIDPQDIKKIIDSYRKNPDATYCAMTEIKDEEEYRSPNIPKVVTDLKKNLLYMSRSAIPSNKKFTFKSAMKQVCIYAFPKKHLEEFGPGIKKTPIEEIEDIELLRLLERNLKVRMVEIKNSTVAVDTPEDLERVISLFND